MNVHFFDAKDIDVPNQFYSHVNIFTLFASEAIWLKSCLLVGKQKTAAWLRSNAGAINTRGPQLTGQFIQETFSLRLFIRINPCQFINNLPTHRLIITQLLSNNL